MSRFWNRFAGVAIDVIGAGWLCAIVLCVALIAGVGWHAYPAWLRGSLPRWPWRWAWPWRRPRRHQRVEDAPEQGLVPSETLPDLPVATFVSRADALAAQGRFAEAVRERLRAIVRELVDTKVIHAHPEWTVSELARAAAAERPALRPSLDAATRTFSDIWYGQRTAYATHDAGMRAHADDVHAILLMSVEVSQ